MPPVSRLIFPGKGAVTKPKATPKPRGGSRAGSGRPKGADNTVGYGEVTKAVFQFAITPWLPGAGMLTLEVVEKGYEILRKSIGEDALCRGEK